MFDDPKEALRRMQQQLLAQEEAEIRDNPLEYASSMIKKVFGAVKQGLVP